MQRFNQAPLKCLAGDEVTRVLKEIYAGVCGEHQVGFRIYKGCIHLGYYWPIMEPNVVSFARF